MRLKVVFPVKEERNFFQDKAQQICEQVSRYRRVVFMECFVCPICIGGAGD